MKLFSRSDLDNLEKRTRANLINSLSGYKSANLIGTISAAGVSNLAIFSSVVHIGADPPLLGLIMRPLGEVARHTYDNIKQNSFYTINHIHENFIEKAHWTSAKFPNDVSEFQKCKLHEEFIQGFPAPFVVESKIKIGLKLAAEIPIKLNGTILIIGEIQNVMLTENALLETGNVDLNIVGDVAISGLDNYHKVRKIGPLPYAKTSNIPNFER